jgi:hypothetical protein
MRESRPALFRGRHFPRRDHCALCGLVYASKGSGVTCIRRSTLKVRLSTSSFQRFGTANLRRALRHGARNQVLSTRISRRPIPLPLPVCGGPVFCDDYLNTDQFSTSTTSWNRTTAQTKRRVNAKQGFRAFAAARRTVDRCEAIHQIRKGQVRWPSRSSSRTAWAQPSKTARTAASSPVMGFLSTGPP